LILGGSHAGSGGRAHAVVLEEGVGTVEADVGGLRDFLVGTDARGGLVEVLDDLGAIRGAEGLSGSTLGFEAAALREGDVLAEEAAALNGAVRLDEGAIVDLVLVAHDLSGLQHGQTDGVTDVVSGEVNSHDDHDVGDEVGVLSPGHATVLGVPEHTSAGFLSFLRSTDPEISLGGVGDVTDGDGFSLGGGDSGVGDLEVVAVSGDDGVRFAGIEGGGGARFFVVALEEGDGGVLVFVDLSPGLTLVGGLEDSTVVEVALRVRGHGFEFVSAVFEGSLGVSADGTGELVLDDEDAVVGLGANDDFSVGVVVLVVDFVVVGRVEGRARAGLRGLGARARATVVAGGGGTNGHEPSVLAGDSDVGGRSAVVGHGEVDLLVAEGAGTVVGDHEVRLEAVTDSDVVHTVLGGGDGLRGPDDFEGHGGGEPFVVGEVLETLADGEVDDGGEGTRDAGGGLLDGDVHNEHGHVGLSHGTSDLSGDFTVVLVDTEANTVGATSEVALGGGGAVSGEDHLGACEVRGSEDAFPTEDGLGLRGERLGENRSGGESKSDAELEHRFDF